MIWVSRTNTLLILSKTVRAVARRRISAIATSCLHSHRLTTTPTPWLCLINFLRATFLRTSSVTSWPLQAMQVFTSTYRKWLVLSCWSSRQGRGSKTLCTPTWQPKTTFNHQRRISMPQLIGGTSMQFVVVARWAPLLAATGIQTTLRGTKDFRRQMLEHICRLLKKPRWANKKIRRYPARHQMETIEVQAGAVLGPRSSQGNLSLSKWLRSCPILV